MFDETVFPFAKLNPNAGAPIRSEVLLLSESAPLDHGDEHIANEPSGNFHENTAVNFGGNPVLHHDFMQQQGTNTEHEADSGAAPDPDGSNPHEDPPSPAASDSGNSGTSASGPGGPSPGDHVSPRGATGETTTTNSDGPGGPSDCGGPSTSTRQAGQSPSRETCRVAQ